MKFLLLNQTFHPDVMATGQYLSDVAVRLVERGHDVTVVTSRRAYDDPARRFPGQETWRGVRIYRVGSTGFGKGAPWRRVSDFASFMVLCALRLLFLPRPDVIVALTSPPLISFLGASVARLRRSRFIYWVMDFNPDEAIAAGWLSPGSVAARLLESISRFSLRHAHRIIALDRFMCDRIKAKGIPESKIVVIPPWSHEDVRFDPEGRTRFRQAHGLEGKFVVMYSGNHSPCHPLDTLLEAARHFSDDPDTVFCFIGGGSEFRKIETMLLDNTATTFGHLRLRAETFGLRCLPYQPLDFLSASLSAADLHVVVMGNAFVGLVHPCKIYNILNVGAPVLYIGPEASHVSEILNGAVGEQVQHGDAEGIVNAIERVKHRAGKRQAAPEFETPYSQKTLLPKLVTTLESC